MKKYIITLIAIFSIVAFAQTTIDVSKIKDGTYIGNYKASFKDKQGDYQAKVTVKGGKIASITLTKAANKNGFEKSKKAYKDIIGASSIDINSIMDDPDSVTGATWKSLVQDALKTK